MNNNNNNEHHQQHAPPFKNVINNNTTTTGGMTPTTQQKDIQLPHLQDNGLHMTDKGLQQNKTVVTQPTHPNHFGEGNLIGPGQLHNFQPPVRPDITDPNNARNNNNNNDPTNTNPPIPARIDPIGPLPGMSRPNPDHQQPHPPQNPHGNSGLNGFY